MHRNVLQRLGGKHSSKGYDDCFLEGTRAVKLAPGYTASSVAGHHVLRILPTRNWTFDLACGLQEGAQLEEHCRGTNHIVREASVASVVEVCSNRRKA